MNGDRLDLRDLARSVLTEMSDRDRVALMVEMAAALSGPRALDLLSQLRATASLRMQEIIDERYPLHELAEVYGDAQAVNARVTLLAAAKDQRCLWDGDQPYWLPASAREGDTTEERGTYDAASSSARHEKPAAHPQASRRSTRIHELHAFRALPASDLNEEAAMAQSQARLDPQEGRW